MAYNAGESYGYVSRSRSHHIMSCRIVVTYVGQKKWENQWLGMGCENSMVPLFKHSGRKMSC